MNVTTRLMQFMKYSSARQFNIECLDTATKMLGEEINKIAII